MSIASQISYLIDSPPQAGGPNPGSSVLSNLSNVPIYLHVGQRDGDKWPSAEVARNIVTSEAGKKLGDLQSSNPSYFLNDVFTHPTAFLEPKKRSHSSWKEDSLTIDPRPVIRDRTLEKASIRHDPALRTNRKPELNVLRNTCAVDWVSNKNGKVPKPTFGARDALLCNPLPTFINWDVFSRNPEPEPILPP